MDLNCLRSLLFGQYQIKQRKTYTEEHLDDKRNYVVQVFPENNEYLRCRIESRHSNAIRYYAWIQYELSTNMILARYCQCRSGARTIGYCGHVPNIIWYLSYARLRDFKLSSGRKRIVEAIEYI